MDRSNWPSKTPTTRRQSIHSMVTQSWQEAEDWHTAGEPFRIVERLPASLKPGLTVAEQRKHILATRNHTLDVLRRSLCQEPRGHADMYGGFILPPNDSGAHFGVLFWHKDGFSTACGHGTIALGYWAITNNIVRHADDGTTDIVIDVPSGRVIAQASLVKGKTVHVDFINVSSYQLTDPFRLDVGNEVFRLNLEITLAFGGAVYACVNVNQLPFSIEPKNVQEFIRLQRFIKSGLSSYRYQDQYDVYGVCFYDEIKETDQSIVQQNVVVFADGQVDRSPCGSGTAARTAILLAQGRLDSSKKLIHRSIIRTEFESIVTRMVESETKFPACIPRVRGKAYLTGKHNFFIDINDPTWPGFLVQQ